jgi:hypothetical protein
MVRRSAAAKPRRLARKEKCAPARLKPKQVVGIDMTGLADLNFASFPVGPI